MSSNTNSNSSTTATIPRNNSLLTAAELSYQDCVIKSGIRPDIWLLNFDPIEGQEVYDLLYRESDGTLKSGDVSSQARKNYSKCDGVKGHWCNGRLKQLAGEPLAYKDGNPRSYHQPKDKPITVFFPRVTTAVWRLVAKVNNLPMPELPIVLLDTAEATEFWEWVIESNCPVHPTEGEKKAASLISHGYPSMGLPGIYTGYRVTEKGDWVFQADSKDDYQKAVARELVDALKPFDTEGREVTICFDWREGKYSQSKEFKAANTLGKLFQNAIAKIAQLPGPDKGVDDFMVNQEIEDFRAILMKAREVGSEPHDTGNEKKGKQPPAQSVVAYELAEIYRERLAWQSEYQQWLSYEGKLDGVWSVETEETIKGLISTHLQAQDLGGFTAGYVSGIATLLKSDLEAKDWNEQKGLIPMKDGMLDLATKQLLPHAPGYRCTWALPYSWAGRSVGCEPIKEFLLKITGGSKEVAEVLRAVLNACVTGRADLQRYLELIGGGGTGKSTYMALGGALVGMENTVSSQLRLLENNQFETAKFRGKRLVCFPDSERWQGGVSVLKQMTGGDLLRYERKGVQQCRDFKYDGWVMLTANEAPESSDKTSGQERRKLTVHLDTRVREYENRDLIKEFEPYLPGLLEWVLEMSPEEVTRLVKHTDREVPELARMKWEQILLTNPIAAWLDEKAIIDPTARGYVGLGDIEKAGRWLYASFCKYQQENGSKNSISMKRFSSNLRDLLKNQMKVDISEGRDREGSYIGGIGLRCQLDPTGEFYPCPVTKKPFCDGLMLDCDESVTVESLTDVGFDGCDGFSKKLAQSEKLENSQLEIPFPSPQNKTCGGMSEKNPSNPSNPTSASVPAVTEPSQTPKNPSQEYRNFAAQMHRVNALVEAIREAIATCDREAAREAWKKIKGSKTQQEGVKSKLTEEENLSFRLLLNVGFIKGQRVMYIGTKWAEQLGGMELIVDDLRDRNGISCIKPDGSYTTDLDKEDLMPL